jgi:hypothetical protein
MRKRRPTLAAESLEPRLAMSITSIAVTEIMYHPAAPTAAESAAGFTESDFDYVELQNTGAEPVSLQDASLAGGIDFTFGNITLQPGAFLVVAADVEAFQFRYGSVIPLAGAYSGSLGNNGEEIEFQDATGAAVYSFEFDDGWHPQTDGDGFSLTLADANSDPATWGQAAAWMSSTSVHGSPGRSDGPFDPSPPSPPQNLSANLVAPSRVNLQWNAASDPQSGVVQYRITRNGRFLASTTATQFSDLGVPANGTYNYTVTAINGSFGESDSSNTATVSLPHVGDQPAFAPAQVAGVVTELVGRETSGIAASRRNADVFWVHNDGSANRIVAINTFGVALGAISFPGIDPTDIEDIAIGPGPVAGQNYIYLADIGDNDLTRTSLQIFRFAEPAISATSTADQSVEIPAAAIETITLRYPPGVTVDAEALLVDPLTGDLYVLLKEAPTSRVFRVPAASLAAGADVVMTFAGTFAFSEPSGGDISPTGREILIRNEDRVRLYQRSEGQSVIQALLGTPIVVPVVGTPTEPNGEGIAFDRAGNHYYTISEGRDPTLYYFHRTSRSPGGTSPTIPGDLDGDGLVGVRDLIILRQHFGTSGATPAQGDLDGDGTVGRRDLAEFTRQFGTASATPSPAAPASATSSPTATGPLSSKRLPSTRRAPRAQPLSPPAVDLALATPNTTKILRAARQPLIPSP